MSARLSEHYSYIECLATAPRAQRLALIRTATKDQLKTICEIIHNVLNKKVKLPESKRQRLTPYNNIIKRIGRLTCTSDGLKRLLLRYNGVHVKYLLGGPFLDKLGLVVEKWRRNTENGPLREIVNQPQQSPTSTTTTN